MKGLNKLVVCSMLSLFIYSCPSQNSQQIVNVSLTGNNSTLDGENKAPDVNKVSQDVLEVKSVEVFPSNISLGTGELKRIKATVKYSNSNVDENVNWSTSDSSVAIITKDGLIIPNKEGKITLQAISKLDPKKFATVEVNITQSIKSSILSKDNSVDGSNLSDALDEIKNKRMERYISLIRYLQEIKTSFSPSDNFEFSLKGQPSILDKGEKDIEFKYEFTTKSPSNLTSEMYELVNKYKSSIYSYYGKEIDIELFRLDELTKPLFYGHDVSFKVLMVFLDENDNVLAYSDDTNLFDFKFVSIYANEYIQEKYIGLPLYSDSILDSTKIRKGQFIISQDTLRKTKKYNLILSSSDKEESFKTIFKYTRYPENYIRNYILESKTSTGLPLLKYTKQDFDELIDSKITEISRKMESN